MEKYVTCAAEVLPHSVERTGQSVTNFEYL
jgi:hypothetical protein